MKIIFLSVDDILKIHEAQITLFGGLAGVRDWNLLESAVLAPQASFDGSYLQVDAFSMAACYIHGLIKNHPFIDGNKRTGISSGLIFLGANDIVCNFSDEELVECSIKIANSTSSFENVVELLRNKCVISPDRN